MSQTLKDVIENTKTISMTDSALSTLMDFERVIDELDLYAFANWKKGELVEGPIYEKYFVTCTFMWPYKFMPDPRAAERLAEYDCEIYYKRDILEYPVKVKTPDDFKPGTKLPRKGRAPIWLVKISMPKKLMHDITRGYTELDKNKIEDIITLNGGVNAHIDPAEQQAQEMANAQQPAPATAA